MQREKSRLQVSACSAMAITSLVGAATHVLKMREHCPPESQELITAIREDIGRMISHVETLRDVASGK